jgi:hypothetical protein
MLPCLMAAPRVVPDTSIPNDPATLNALNDAVTGGVYRAPTIVLRPGVRLKLKRDLILVADSSLRIHGSIDLAQGVQQPVNITLVCLQGSVVIGAGGRIGRQFAAAEDGADVTSNANTARAQSKPGVNGGYVKILAPVGTITIEGEVHAVRGGNGGTATAVSQPLLGLLGGRAEASGGQAGAGGEVLLVALDGIRAVGIIRAGGAGFGGYATATAQNGGGAEALGGPGNRAGDLRFVGLVQEMEVDLFNAVAAGSPEQGGSAHAISSTPGWGIGGPANANGNVGGEGGTVTFTSCEVSSHMAVEAGNGGAGGHANATGGPGARRPGRSKSGGSGAAVGGDAGPAGAVPQIPVFGGVDQGTINPGVLGFSCTGGDAVAAGGVGGDGFLNGFAGNSGTGYARGGAGCAGVVPAAVTSGPVPAPPVRGAVGPICPVASCAGTN